MKTKPNVPRFFLGVNTPQGFVSRFDRQNGAVDGWRTLIIKGGPGGGKSTLLKRIYETFSERYSDIEVIHCASDMKSVDAVIIAPLRVTIVDGTQPHAIEPKYPGAVESIINMGTCWDEDKLYANRERIIQLTNICTARHEHVCRFLNAAAILSNDTYRTTLSTLDKNKLGAYISRLAARELKPRRNTHGSEKIRFLSAITDKGIHTFVDSVKMYCDKIYLISDDHGAVSRMMLHKLRSAALAAGYDITTSCCPLGPFDKIEHLLIPELNLGFMTSNRMHDLNLLVEPYRLVNSKRFMDMAKLKESKKRFSFNNRAEYQMITQATGLMSEAKELHDELEQIYISATDFCKIDSLIEDTISRIERLEASR